MAEHPNVARIRDGYAAFAKGDFAVPTELFAEDLLWHDSGRTSRSQVQTPTASASHLTS